MWSAWELHILTGAPGRTEWREWRVDGTLVMWMVEMFCHWTPPQINGKDDIDLSPPGEKALATAMVIHHRWSLGDVDSIDSFGNIGSEFQIAHFEGKPHTLTWTGGMIRCFFEGGYSEFFFSKRKFNRKSKMAMSSCPLYRLQTCDLVVIPREN